MLWLVELGLVSLQVNLMVFTAVAACIIVLIKFIF